jgi:hypothetical protein
MRELKQILRPIPDRFNESKRKQQNEPRQHAISVAIPALLREQHQRQKQSLRRGE